MTGRTWMPAAGVLAALLVTAVGCGSSARQSSIEAIFDRPLYDGAIWGLRVVDLDSGEVLIDREPDYPFFIGSVRKVFTIGELLEAIGPEHEFETPIYTQGTLDGGVLDGELVLVASGDLTMGGRTNPDGTIAISDFDHNEADSLGNAVLTAPDPLQGYRALARRVAEAGITLVGDVVIDDRLFVPYPFRGEFDIRPIFVNDDVVDVTIEPGVPGGAAPVSWRPHSAAFDVAAHPITTGPGTEYTLELDPELPACIGAPACAGEVVGQLPVDFVPPLTNAFPLVQTFRIVEPQNYARTVLIEALEEEGVVVEAPTVAPNPVAKLPSKDSYDSADRVTSLVSLPYSDYAKLILKVSYNIGADTSLLLYGLTLGVDDMDAALRVERERLTSDRGIPGDSFFFVDGSGGGLTTARNAAVTRFLRLMRGAPAFDLYKRAMPILGVDGSLSFVRDFESDPSLAGARGNVFAKTGTFAEGNDQGELILRGQALGGYVDAKSGRRLVFEMAVNEVPIEGIPELLEVFQDQGTISAILWRDY